MIEESSENYNVRAMKKFQVHQLVNFHTSILGTSGSGKTELAKAMFNYAPYSAFFVNTMRHKLEGVPITSDNWELAMFAHTQGRTVKAHMAPRVHQDFDDFALEIEEMLGNIKVVQEVLGNKRLFIFVDEIQLYSEIDGVIRNLILLGRNYETYIVSISQRPQNIDKNIFSQSNMVYSHFDEFDFKYCHRLGIHGLRKTKKFEFVYYPKANSEGEQYVMKMAFP